MPIKSKLWNFYKKGVEVGIGNRCNESIKTKNANSAGLRNHLKIKHPNTDYIVLLAIEKESDSIDLENESASVGAPPAKKQKQSTLIESFVRNISNDAKWDDKSEQSIKINKLLIEWFVVDYISFKFVEGAGFKKFMNAAYPKYHIKGVYRVFMFC